MVFTYDNIPQGQDWALEMYRGSQKMQGSDHEEWQDGESGWAAYELSEDLSDNPLAGPYTVKLLIGAKVVQKASFEVAAQPINQISFPAFGPITFAHDVNDESAAIDPATVIRAGHQPGLRRVPLRQYVCRYGIQAGMAVERRGDG